MNLTRQHGTLPESVLSTRVTIVGAGGIGSWTTLTLAKLGFKHLEVFDDDTVDDVNIPSQCYAPTQVGKLKVEALKDVVALMTGTTIEAKNKRFDECMSDVLIVAVDNMGTRKDIAEKFKRGAGVFAKTVIDARMAIESGMIIPYKFESVQGYLDSLYTDDEAVADPCTNRAISYTTQIIAGLISKSVIAAVKDNLKVSAEFNLKTGDTKPDIVMHTNPFAATVTVSVEEDSDASDEGEFYEESYPF